MPTWKFSGPPAPVRMMAGKATEPSSALPTRLNCCCRTVDLKRGEIPGQGMPTAPAPRSVGVLPPKDWQLFLQTHCAASLAGACSPFNSCLAANCCWKTYFFGDTESSSMVDSSSPSSPKWSLLFFCRGKEKTCQPAHTSQPSPPPAARYCTRATGSPYPISSSPSSTVCQWLSGGSWKGHPAPLSGGELIISALLSTASPF